MLAVKEAIYAVAERKPDKNEKFRLAGIQTLASAIPVQCSNQYVLYCYLTYPIPHVYFVYLLHLGTFTVYVFRTLSVKYGLCI